MALSQELISQFAKIVNSKNQKNKKTTTYGTIVMVGNEKYVKIDGSEILTPFDNTVTVKNDDRVTVSVDNHRVTVTGSTTNPSFSKSDGDAIGNKINEFDIIISHKITVDEINAITRIFSKYRSYKWKV